MSECKRIPSAITNYSTKSIVTALVGTKTTTRGKFIEIPWLTVKDGVITDYGTRIHSIQEFIEKTEDGSIVYVEEEGDTE